MTIEHIMPQKLSPQWQKDLGETWENIHNKWLNTLANLTLSAYNSEYSNRPFSEKKTIENGFELSPLLLNRYIAKFDRWNEETLEERAEWLKNQITNIWKYPKTTLTLSDENSNDNNLYSPYKWAIETYAKPKSMLIEEDLFEIKNWVDFYIKTLQFIHENFNEEFTILIDNINLFGTKKDQPLISMNKNSLRKAREVSSGIFAEINLNVETIIKNVIKICDYVGFNQDNCPIYFML